MAIFIPEEKESNTFAYEGMTHVRQKEVLSKQLYCVCLSSLIYTHYSIFEICLPLSLCQPNNERFLPNLHVLVQFK